MAPHLLTLCTVPGSAVVSTSRPSLNRAVQSTTRQARSCLEALSAGQREPGGSVGSADTAVPQSAQWCCRRTGPPLVNQGLLCLSRACQADALSGGDSGCSGEAVRDLLFRFLSSFCFLVPFRVPHLCRLWLTLSSPVVFASAKLSH